MATHGTAVTNAISNVNRSGSVLEVPNATERLAHGCRVHADVVVHGS